MNRFYMIICIYSYNGRETEMEAKSEKEKNNSESEDKTFLSIKKNLLRKVQSWPLLFRKRQK